MKSWGVDKFELEDWDKYFRQLVRLIYDVPVATPKGAIKRAFQRLLNDIENPYIVIMALEHVLFESQGFVKTVSPGEKILTIGVLSRAVHSLGGYDQPWESLYYRRFAQNATEAQFFKKWLSLYTDANEAPLGTDATIGDEKFINWDYVKQLSVKRLNDAITVIKKRFEVEGPQEARNWNERELIPAK